MPRMTHVSLRHRPLRLLLQNLGATSRYKPANLEKPRDTFLYSNFRHQPVLATIALLIEVVILRKVTGSRRSPDMNERLKPVNGHSNHIPSLSLLWYYRRL